MLGAGADGKVIQPEGMLVSSMNSTQQALLLDVIHEWVGILNDDAASARMAEIDTNGDRRVDAREADAYARQVLRSVAVSFDRQAVALALGNVQVPDVADMRLGTGIIRLRASGSLPAVRSGRHQVTVVNTHRPESSVYLANALVPDDRRVEIVAQQHARDQHSLTIDYAWTMPTRWTRTAWLVAGLAGLVILGTARRPRRAS